MRFASAIGAFWQRAPLLTFVAMSAITGNGRPTHGPRTFTCPYPRIALLEPSPPDGPDPYGNADPEPAWMRIDWRSHVGTIELGADRVNYAEIGDGPAIIFIHGLGGCWQNWLETMPRMAELGHRAIALDLPGFGASPMPTETISIPGYGELIDRFRTALAVGRCTLVGNSMGGLIAAEVATGEPAWLEDLMLVSAAGISHAEMRREPATLAARMMTMAKPLMRFLDMPSVRRPGLRELAVGGVARHPLRLRPELLAQQLLNGFDAPGFVAATSALVGYDLRERLRRIGVPTLIVWGRNDRVVPATDGAGYAARITGSRLVVFDDCGHVPMLERPLRFNRLLAELSAAAP